MSTFEVFIKDSTRVFPRSKPISPQSIPLSLLDATTADFSLTSAIWVFNQPPSQDNRLIDLFVHLRHTLSTALDAYPHFAGTIKAITATDGTGPEEALHFPTHARRFGRTYAHWGVDDDPGLAFTTATSSLVLADLYDVSRTETSPLWNQEHSKLQLFAPTDAIASAFDPVNSCSGGTKQPIIAVQITQLAAGGFVLAAKAAHSLVDITGLRTFIKDWGSISRARLFGVSEPVLQPFFDPSKLDELASGDIDSPEPDPKVIAHAKQLPLHRYDWWASAASCPWPVNVPEPFRHDDLEPAGKVMPWSEWDFKAPVSHYIIHFTRDQAEYLYEKASRGSAQRLSRHDAILAHVWSCIIRSRNLNNSGLLHCDLVYGVRPHIKNGKEFIGSPTLMMNVEISAADFSDRASYTGEYGNLGAVASQVRTTIGRIAQSDSIAAHLCSIAYEKSPQRVWQAFLGSRHIIVTSWARAGVYDVDFGLGSVRYADSVMPNMDGIVVIKEAPRRDDTSVTEEGASWTEAGVDVSVHIEAEAMRRLLQDPLLLPSCVAR